MSIDILVSKGQMNTFLKFLYGLGIPFKISIQDVKDVISAQRQTSAPHIKQAEFNWDEYQSVEDIHTFLNKLANEYPSIATVQVIGKSFEGRDLKLIKISTGNSSSKRAVYMDGGTHGNEWISGAVVTYMISELVINAFGNLDILAEFDFYIVPSLNPDGYEYSRSTDRAWRKTRSENPGTGCDGTDPNRNFGYKWGEPGGHPDPCHIGYLGRGPFSESETFAVQNFILNESVDWTFYLSFHNFGQWCAIPFADGIRSDDFAEMVEKCDIFAEALFQVAETKYQVGNLRDLACTNCTTVGSGLAMDWAKATANIKFSYTIELRDKGEYGFLLPPEQIKETARETWAGIQAMIRSEIR